MNRDLIATSVVSQISTSPKMPDVETKVEFSRHALPISQRHMGKHGVVCYWMQIDSDGNAETCTGFIDTDLKVYYGGEARVHITEALGSPEAFDMFIQVFSSSVEDALSKIVPASVPQEPDNHLGAFSVG